MVLRLRGVTEHDTNDIVTTKTSDFEISKKVILLRHSQKVHREEDGAVHFWRMRKIFRIQSIREDSSAVLILQEQLCAEQTQAVYVIMFADMAFLEGVTALVTLVFWRSHRVKRVVASASAAEAMGLSKAVAQGDWVRALWSEVVLGLGLREWRDRENVQPLISVTDSKGNYDHLHNETVVSSVDRRSAIDLAIIRGRPSRPQMFLRSVDGQAHVADALTKLHGDGDLLRAVRFQAFTVLVEALEIMAARRQEKRERERVPRVNSPLKLREPVDETSTPVTTTTIVT